MSAKPMRRAAHAAAPPPIYQLEIALVSETLSRPRHPPRVRFEPDTEWLLPPTALFVSAGTMNGVLYNDNLRPAETRPPDQPWAPWPDQDRNAREQGITGITIADSWGRDITLQTGKLHAPMEAMRACTQELTTHWGLEPAVPGPLARGAFEHHERTVRRFVCRAPVELHSGRRIREHRVFLEDPAGLIR